MALIRTRFMDRLLFSWRRRMTPISFSFRSSLLVRPYVVIFLGYVKYWFYLRILDGARIVRKIGEIDALEFFLHVYFKSPFVDGFGRIRSFLRRTLGCRFNFRDDELKYEYLIGHKGKFLILFLSWFSNIGMFWKKLLLMGGINIKFFRLWRD